ncbi:MAG TPA: response regulator [Verrucomicrobiae bacterium]|nr:response regulator [Verrucomicrobiae bacterium]
MSEAHEPKRPAKQPTILVADDDSNDIFFLKRAFHKAGCDCRLIDVPDGEKAIEYLSGEKTYSDRSQFPVPNLLILDLKMPKVNGFEVLAWLQQHRQLASMKVVVLSSSGLQSDRQKAEDLGAHDYRTKPGDISEMLNLVRDLQGRWLS